MKPLISIIIPMHNAENTIERCLDSLWNQTIKNLQIIVIDDNSEDRSYSIAEKYKSKFLNFILIQNGKNMGDGALKNRGLCLADADFIGFIDATDFVDRVYYEKMLKVINEFNADIAFSDIVLTFNGHVKYKSFLEGNLLLESLNIKGNEEPIVIQPMDAAAYWGALFAIAKLFKKKSLGLFGENICEDIPFVFPVLAKSQKIIYIPQNYYFRTKAPLGGLSSTAAYIEWAESISKTAAMILVGIEKYDEIARIMYGNNVWPILMHILSDRVNRIRNLEAFYCKLKYKELLNANSYQEKSLETKSWGEQRFILAIIRFFLDKEFNEMCQTFDQYGDNSYFYLPSVSIVIPVYNGSNYLEEAIASALMQNYPNLEVIVVNDGSRDDGATENIARSFGNRIKYYHKENGGVASALNYGIEHMTGEYFSWLSHDDLYKRDKVLKQIEALQELKDKRTIVVCGYELVNENLEKLYDVNLTDIYPREQVERPLFAVFKGGINGCATLIHKSHFERVGMFDVELPTTQDYDLWFRMMRGQRICYLPGNYVLSRSHEGQDSKKLYDKHILECNQLWINLMEAISDEEKKSISGTVLQFYQDEREFFGTLPYSEVVNYLENKLLDVLRDSIKNKNSIDIKIIYDLMHLNEETAKFDQFIEAVCSNEKKCVVVLSETTFVNNAVQETLKEVKVCNKDFWFVCVIISEKNKALDWIDWNHIVLNPTQYIATIPKVLKLLDAKLCIMCDNDDIQDALYLMCSSLGVKTVAWKMSKHWILKENTTPKNCISQIKISSNVDFTIWTDFESAIIDSQKNGNVAYIPLVSQNENKENIKQSWMQVFSGKYNQLKEDMLYECSLSLSKRIIKKYEEVVVQSLGEKQQYQPQTNEPHKSDDWEDRYYAVINSTSWKLTKPVRWIADRIKR